MGDLFGGPAGSAWSDARTVGWGGDWAAPGEAYPVEPLLELFERRWTSDAHFVRYVVLGPDGVATDRQPRLRVSAVPALEDKSCRVVVTAAVVDLDLHPHLPWANGQTGTEARRAIAAAGALFPNAITHTTRGGLRLAWALPRALNVTPGAGEPGAGAWLRAWTDELARRGIGDALAKAAGMKPGTLRLDTTAAEWSRCFRLPMVRRDHIDLDPILDLVAWREDLTLDWSPTSAQLAASATGPARRAAPVDWSPPPEPPPPHPPDNSHLWELAKRGKRSGGEGGLVEIMQAGAPLAEHGDRNNALMRGIGVLACQWRGEVALGDDIDAPRVLASLIYGAMLASVEAMDSPTATAGVLWSKALEFAAREVALVVERRAQARDAAAIAEHQDEDTRPTVGLEEAGLVSRPVDAKAVNDANPPAPALVLPVVVVNGSKFHVLDVACPSNGYGPAVSGVGLHAALRDRAPDTPRKSMKGQLYPAGKIVDNCGTTAIRVAAEYGRKATTFDPRTGTLLRAAGVPLPCPAEHHPGVAAWLEALVVNPFDRGLLLDWLATVTILDRPTAALYLQGPKGTGKTLLAEGVASIWWHAPVAFIDAVSRFNAGLLRCPVVHLSESLDWVADGRRRSVSGAFRALVGDRTRGVEEKHEAKGELVGYPRVVVAANRDDALPLGHWHTRADLAAVAERIRHVVVSPEASSVLKGIAGDELATWARPGGAIPQHIWWLVKTRQAAALGRAGERFLVAGDLAGSLARRMVLRAGDNGMLLSAIGEAVAPSSGVQGGAAVKVVPDGDDPRQGVVWVNAHRLHGSWKNLVSEDAPRPRLADVARGLRELSGADSSRLVRLGGGGRGSSKGGISLRCWDVPGDLIILAAEEHGAVNLERLCGALAGTGGAGAQGGQGRQVRAES